MNYFYNTSINKMGRHTSQTTSKLDTHSEELQLAVLTQQQTSYAGNLAILN